MVLVACLSAAACTGGSHAVTSTTNVSALVSRGPGTGVNLELRVTSAVVHAGDSVPVTVTLTDTAAHSIVVGDCLSIMGVYPAFLDLRTGRTLSGPGNLSCDAVGRILQAGQSRTYTAHARAFTGIPPKAREQRLPPGEYLLALRPLSESRAQFGLDRVPPLKVTVVS